MTLSTLTQRADYSSVGGAAYAFPFRILTKADLLVYVGGVLKVVDTHYTIPPADIDNSVGGTITFAPAASVPAAGAIVSLLRATPQTQETSLAEGSKFPAETLEGAFDKLTMQVQDLEERFSRVPTLTRSSLLGPLSLPEGAGKTLRWNGAGTALEVVSPDPGIGAVFTDITVNGNIMGDGGMVVSGIADIITTGPWVDVRAFGVVAGDGITDYHSEIQAAIAVAEAVGGKVLFPIGQYNLGTTGITVNGNGVILEGISPRFVGASAFGVEFLYSGAGDAVTYGTSGTINYRNEFNNIQVRATGAAIASATAGGVKTVNQHYLTSRNAAIKDFRAGRGLCLTAAGEGMFSATSQYHGIMIHLCKRGISAVGVDAFTKENHAIFLGGAVIGEIIAGSIGIDLDQYADGFRFYGTDVETFETGIQVAGSSNAFFGTRTEFNTKAVRITATGVRTEFYGHQWAGSNRDIDDSGTFTTVLDNYGFTGQMNILPVNDVSELLTIKKANGAYLVDVSSSGVPRIEVLNGMDFIMYSGMFDPVVFKVSGSTGNTDVGGAMDVYKTLKVRELPAANPGAGSKQLWYDPADGNTIKFAP